MHRHTIVSNWFSSTGDSKKSDIVMRLTAEDMSQLSNNHVNPIRISSNIQHSKESEIESPITKLNRTVVSYNEQPLKTHKIDNFNSF